MIILNTEQNHHNPLRNLEIGTSLVGMRFDAIILTEKDVVKIAMMLSSGLTEELYEYLEHSILPSFNNI